MILLRRLHVRALKQLRDVDLWLPRRGSVLIEGHNEAGKSTIFEAIYFALYGAPLIGEDTRPTLDDLIPHDASSAAVELTVLAGETELEIRRTLSAGKGGRRATQQARLMVRRPGAPTEELNTPSAVNTRIQQELSGLDGETLRNSCFMEQKALDRLESLKRDQREAAIARLLGLDRLRRVEADLAAEAAERERELARLRGELEVASLRRRANAASAAASDLADRVRALRVRALLGERDGVAATQAQHWQHASELDTRQAALAERLEQATEITALQRALAETADVLTRARAASDATRAAHAELAALEQLDVVEGPTLEARIAALRQLEALLAAATAAEAETEALVATQRANKDVEVARHTVAESERELQRATLHETLTRWADLADARALVHGDDAQAQTLERERQEWQADASRTQHRAARLLVATIVVALLAAGASAGGIAWHLAWALAGALIAVAVALAGLSAATRGRARQARLAYERVAARITELNARTEAAHRFAGRLDELPRLEAALRTAEVPIPANAQAAREQVAAMPASAATSAVEAQARLRAAEQTLARGVAERDAALARANSRSGQASEIAVADLASRIEAAHAQGNRLRAEARELAETTAVVCDATAITAARGAAESRLADLHQRTAALGDARRQVAEQAAAEAEPVRQVTSALAKNQAEVERIGLVSPQPALYTGDVTLPALAEAHAVLVAACSARAAQVDEAGARQELAKIAGERDAFARQQPGAAEVSFAERIAALMAEQGIPDVAGTETAEELSSRWPALARDDEEPADTLDRALMAAGNEAHHLRETVAALETKCGLADVSLDEDDCERRVAAGEAALRHYSLAREMAHEVQARIVRHVLPETESYMRALLPELTAGRYRDVQLLADESGGSGADLGIRVWDNVAGRYVGKRLFSGGTRDQCSLALRLAFALATLPKELGALPGFMFLDEPLSSFDAERTRALVGVLTQGTIAQQFAQVLLISHSQSFARNSFRYHVRLAGGRIAESNLPSAQEARDLWTIESAVRSATIG